RAAHHVGRTNDYRSADGDEPLSLVEHGLAGGGVVQRDADASRVDARIRFREVKLVAVGGALVKRLAGGDGNASDSGFRLGAARLDIRGRDRYVCHRNLAMGDTEPAPLPTGHQPRTRLEPAAVPSRTSRRTVRRDNEP